MDHLTIEEHNVVERYLMRKLDGAEIALFEEHYLDCQECLEKLELSKRLYQGLQEIAAQEVPKTLAQTTILAWILKRGRPFQGVLILGLLTVVVLPWALLAPELGRMRGEQERLSGELVQALAPQTQTPIFSLSPERSASDEEPSTRVTVGSTPEWVVLALQLPPYQTSALYRVRLLEAEGTSLWQSGPLQPNASGQIMLSVHSSWLEAKDYHLRLNTLTAEGEELPVTRFSFRVRSLK
jgi:hypothetical protein